MGEITKPPTPIFINGRLDDYGLIAAHFRIYCRIARRGECWETIDNMARGCRMNKDTVCSALKFLVKAKMIRKESRLGRSSIYKITPMDNWNPSENRGHVTHRKTRGTGYMKTGGTHPTEKEGYKVPPTEVAPIKGESPHVLGGREKGGNKVLLISLEKNLVELREELLILNNKHEGTWKTAPENDRAKRSELKTQINSVRDAINKILAQEIANL